jgi:hypothetical protein
MNKEQQIRLWCLAGCAAALTALYFFLALDNLLVHRFRDVPFYIPKGMKHSTLQGIGWTASCTAVAALSMAIRAGNTPERVDDEPPPEAQLLDTVLDDKDETAGAEE